MFAQPAGANSAKGGGIADTTGAKPPSPTGAALRSLILPGWGQAYVGHPLKAVIYGGIEQSLIFAVYRQHRLFRYHDERGEESEARHYHNQRNRLTWYLTAALILSMMDAFVDAHLYDFDVSEDFPLSMKPSLDSAAIPGSGFTPLLFIRLSWSMR